MEASLLLADCVYGACGPFLVCLHCSLHSREFWTKRGAGRVSLNGVLERQLRCKRVGRRLRTGRAGGLARRSMVSTALEGGGGKVEMGRHNLPSVLSV